MNRKLSCALLALAACSGNPSLILEFVSASVDVAVAVQMQCGAGPKTEMEECKPLPKGETSLAFPLVKPEDFERTSVICQLRIRVLDSCGGLQLLEAQTSINAYASDEPMTITLDAGRYNAAFDEDGDGVTNWTEHLAGSDPRSRASTPMMGCVPKTCAEIGFDCGTANDGCGGSIECGTCGGGATCGGGGLPNRCGSSLPNAGCTAGPGPYRLVGLASAPMPFSYTAGQAAAQYFDNVVVVRRGKVHMFEVANVRWTEIGGPPPDNDREGPVASVENRLYFAGGHSNRTVFADVDLFDLNRRTWASLPDLPAPRAAAVALVHGGFLYVIGGERVIHGAGERDVWRIHLANPTQWQAVAPLPTPRVYSTGVVYEDKLWIIGGASVWQDRNPSLELTTLIYDPARDQWLGGPNLPRGAGNAGAAVLCGALYVAGGVDQNGQTQRRVEVNFPIGSDVWYSGQDLPLDVAGVGVVAVNERFFAFGGWSNSLNGWTNQMLFAAPNGRYDR